MAVAPSGVSVSIELDEDELLGVHLLAMLEGVADDDPAGFSNVVSYTLRRGIIDRFLQAGLEWPPTADAFATAQDVGREISGEESPSEEDSSETARRMSRLLLAAIGVALVVIVIGGYVGKWAWTGLNSNNQVWDWLHLLLLPVAFGLFPLWLRFNEYMSPFRRRLLGGIVIAFAAFVAVGYLAPLSFSGFKGQTLWSWLTLIVLPISLMTIRLWPTTGRQVKRHHVALVAAISAALLVTLIGGYEGTWIWTGYKGNTLWDWMSLVLAPIAISSVVIPRLVKLVSGDANTRAEAAEAREAREKALAVARERAGTA